MGSETKLPSKSFEEYKFDPQIWNAIYLRHCAINMKLGRPRSLAWAIMLEALPEPSIDFINSLNRERKKYYTLQLKYTTNPHTVIDDDPLSQKDESVWNQYFCDNELKALILQDVVRTYPDDSYFQDNAVQETLVRVLFIWARTHAYIGYRQGMHEVLAHLLLEIYLDRKEAPNDKCEILEEYLREECLESDSYILFNQLMKGLKRFYTTGHAVPTACGRLPSVTAQHSPSEVVRYLIRVKEDFLSPSDPDLASQLDACHISLELFGIRWLRLLFGREFPRAEVPLLWSYLFCDGPALPNLHYVIIALLISMRSTLLSGDSGTALSALMRPPAVPAALVILRALHLFDPRAHPRPRSPPPAPVTTTVPRPAQAEDCVCEGADVARELATLAVLRARLPPAAAALAAAAHAQPRLQRPLRQILQLSSLVQCRNHALVDVETALEAAEGQIPNKTGKSQLIAVRRGPPHSLPAPLQVNKYPREVPLTVFSEYECDSTNSNLPALDPLRLRTE